MTSRTVLLDAGPLGLVTHPRVARNRQAVTWLRRLNSSGVRIMVPEIADYEVRRELLRAGREEGVRRLDALQRQISYLPITTRVMRLAARFWADARRQGQPTAPDEALDGDVILAAQAVALAEEEGLADVVIAATNVGHLSRFTAAERWEEIEPSP